MKLNIILGAIALFLLGTTWMSVHQLRKKKEELSNSREIITQLRSDKITYKVNKDSTKTAIVETIVVDNSNASALLGQNKALKEQVGKFKSLNSLQAIELQSRGSGSIKIKDSLRLIDSFTWDTLKYFDYQDNYLNLHGEEVNKILNFSYLYQDSLTVIIYKKNEGKWYQFWKWGKKKYMTNVTFKNPKAEAVKIESIIIK